MEFDFIRFAVIAAALSVGALVKGATGMGLPLVALPFMTTFFGLQHSIAILTLPIIYTNVWQVWRHRDQWNGPRMAFMPLFLIGGFIGIIVGTMLLTSLPERLLVLVLGVILIAYVALRLIAPQLSVGPVMAQRAGPIAGLGAGLLQGATGISAPIGVTFIHAMALERAALIFAVSAMFLLFAFTQLGSLSVAGVMTWPHLLESIVALIPIFIFLPLGQRLTEKLSREAFDRVLLTLLGVMGLKMVLGL